MRALRLLLICGALLTALGAQLSAQAPSFAETKKQAEAGNSKAQSVLGAMYANGEGVPQDYAEAAKWWRKSADQGYAKAQYNLGLLNENGIGVPKDLAEAARWYRKAADQGYADAQSNLGFIFCNGEGVQQDYTEALKWWRKAADQGNASAQYNLGLMYVKNRKAADQGVAEAQSNLGVMYEKGDGVPKDDIEAYAMYNLAAVTNDLARKNRDILARRLSPSVQLLAQQRTKQLQQEIENREIERLKKEDQKRREEMKKGA